MKIIGLTGGIGSGKTTVARMFAELGIPIYIADDEAKKLSDASPEIRKDLLELLGDEAYNGDTLNRKFVAEKIFNDKNLLNRVNHIIHPRVGEHFNKWASAQNSSYVIKEAAILFENGGYKACDAIILVTAPKAVRIQRVINRDNSSLQEVESRMSNQWSDSKKKKLSDFLVENLAISDTKKQVEAIHNILLH